MVGISASCQIHLECNEENSQWNVSNLYHVSNAFGISTLTNTAKQRRVQHVDGRYSDGRKYSRADIDTAGVSDMLCQGEMDTNLYTYM